MNEFDGMTAAEIARKIEEAKAALAFAQETEIASLKAEIMDRCAEFCIDPYELFRTESPTRAKPVPRFVGPNGETWSGKGKRPAWVIRELEGLEGTEAADKLNSFRNQDW